MGELLDTITAGMDWPPYGHADRIAAQDDYSLLARNRRDEVVQRHNVDLLRYVDDQEDVVLYPAVRIVARAVASLLFGEEPTYEHPDEAVAEQVRALSADTNLTAVLLGGAYTGAVEGEVYLRPTWDVDVDDTHAIMQAVPGSRVIPVFRYGRLTEAVVVTAWQPPDDRGRASGTHWRLLEFYEPGLITRRLYSGNAQALGRQRDLSAQPRTADLEEQVGTGIDHVGLVHVPLPAVDLNTSHGHSLFDGLESMVLALHRLYSQDQHDAEMARRRVAVSEAFIERDARGRPSMDRRTDLLVLSDEAAGAVGDENTPIIPIEFDDDMVMSDRIGARFRDFLIACGISPDTIDANEAGGAISGTSRRLAQAMTIQTVSGIARQWRYALGDALRLACNVERVHLRADGGPVVDPVQATLGDGFVEDEHEQADIIATLDTAEAISPEQKVRRLHPDWDDEQVQAEVEAIGGSTPPPPPATGVPGGVIDVATALRAGTRRDPDADAGGGAPEGDEADEAVEA